MEEVEAHGARDLEMGARPVLWPERLCPHTDSYFGTHVSHVMASQWSLARCLGLESRAL